MIGLFPYRFKELGQTILVSNDAGDFFFTTQTMLERLVNKSLSASDEQFLLAHGFAFRTIDDLYFTSNVVRIRERKRIRSRLSYIIAIPTLRCDLTCTYCQVSRANIDASGYDWTEKTVQDFLNFIDKHKDSSLKIEFQGGEPTLRADVIQRALDHCEKNLPDYEIIICTNLSTLSNEVLRFLENPHVFVSTSFDGPADIHTANRTRSADRTAKLLSNIDFIRRRFGENKVSALPTIAPAHFGRITEIIDEYKKNGFRQIYLRPTNYHGFARKLIDDSQQRDSRWQQAYEVGLEHIFNHNWTGDDPIIETNFEIFLKRIFSPNYTSHVDLRSPNPSALDYIVVNFDGRLFPSDEARMLDRINQIDLSIGTLEAGVDTAKQATLNWHQLNEVDPDCIHCAHQPWCGVDIVDRISRERRIDAPTIHTSFCRNSTSFFDRIFKMILECDPKMLMNMSGHLTGRFQPTPFIEPNYYDPAITKNI